MPLYAGVCETNITPPVGVWMCGYAFRPTGCVAVHDELFARALALHDGAAGAVVLTTDLIGLDFDMVGRVRAGIAERTGLPAGAVMLTSTHTHGGPNVRAFTTMGSRDPAYTDVLERKLIGIGGQAFARMQPASLAYGRAPAQIGVNRRQYGGADGPATRIGRNLAGPVMPWVDALAVRDSRGRPFALLFSHACHPTTLGGDNLEITADFCGYACDMVRDLVGTGVTPMFAQGCAGNINPSPRGTFEDARAHGETVGEAAMEALDNTEPLAGVRVEAAEETVRLPLIPPPPLDECERRVAEWTERLEQERAAGDVGRILHAEGMRDFAERERRIASDRSGDLSTPFTLQRIRLGPAQILAMPGEMFVQYGLDFVRQAEARGPVFALAYTNGVHGYVPSAADYPYGGYEVDGAHRYYDTLMFTPQCEPLIRDAAYRLLGVAQPDRTPYTVEA